MVALELVKDRRTKEPFAQSDPIGAYFVRAVRARGALMRWHAGKIMLSPPLIFTHENVDATIDILDDVLGALQKHMDMAGSMRIRELEIA